MLKKLKAHWSTLLLILVFLVGLSLLLYPSVSDYWNSFHQSRAIQSYVQAVADINDEDYQALLEAAQAYNQKIAQNGNNWQLSEEELAEYNSLLRVADSGIMGYIEIPKIQVDLPIYHGTDEEVLQIGVGHLEGSSLPVGGAGTHTVISGHRGLPSAKLFTNLDQLEEGDIFQLYVLDEVLTYQVDQILIVEPTELSDLQVEDGQDYCTLVTCTPYGINTHRLLVRGHRIENNTQPADTLRVTADAVQIEPMVVAPLLAVPILVVLLVLLLLIRRKRH